MKLIVTETEGLQIQKVLLDLLSEYNRTFQDPEQDINLMVTQTSEKIEEIFEQEPLSEWHKRV